MYSIYWPIYIIKKIYYETLQFIRLSELNFIYLINFIDLIILLTF